MLPLVLTVTDLIAYDNSIPERDLTDLDKRSTPMANMLSYWDAVVAVEGGIETIRQHKQFLPQFNGEKDKAYENRLNHTKLTDLFGDIIEGLAAKPFEKEISFGDEDAVSEEFKTIAENIDGRNNNLTRFAMDVFNEGISKAIDWIWIDYPKKDPSVKTREDQKKRNIRPYWSRVAAMNVLEVKTEMRGSEEILTYFRMLEKHDDQDFVRIFELVDNVVIWSLYEKDDTAKNQWKPVEDGNLTISVIPFVPFITGKRVGKTYEIKPPLKRAIETQIELYQEESGLKFIKTLGAYPMLAANGVNPQKNQDGTIKDEPLGPMRILYSPPGGDGKYGSWNFIEPNGQSMKFLKECIDETKKDLRELGKQPLTAQSNVTVINSAVAASKSRTAVAQWGLSLKDALENAMMITALWLNKPGQEPNISVYDDYDRFLDSESDIAALQKAREIGDVSQETHLEGLKLRGVLPPEHTLEIERKRQLEEIPSEETDENEL